MISNKMVCMCLSQKIVLNSHPEIITFIIILRLSNHLFDITYPNTSTIKNHIIAFRGLFMMEF